MNNLQTLPALSTNIHFGLPKAKNIFSSDTIHLFEPNLKNNKVRRTIKKAIKTKNIKNLEKAIEQCLKHDASPCMMSSLIAVLGESNTRQSLFQLYLESSDISKTVLNNSYMHDNGFEKWVLINNPAFKLRLHIYEDSRLVPQENRHNHSWDFASYIVEGYLQNTVYAINEINGEEELFHYEYSPVEGDVYGAVLIDKIKLRKMTDINLSQGTAYFMPAEVIHRISYEQTFKQRTITLMLTGNRKNYHCDLFSEYEFKEEKRATKRFTSEEMQNRFKELSIHE